MSIYLNVAIEPYFTKLVSMLHSCTSRTCGWFSCFILKKILILCY